MNNVINHVTSNLHFAKGGFGIPCKRFVQCILGREYLQELILNTMINSDIIIQPCKFIRENEIESLKLEMRTKTSSFTEFIKNYIAATIEDFACERAEIFVYLFHYLNDTEDAVQTFKVCINQSTVFIFITTESLFSNNTLINPTDKICLIVCNTDYVASAFLAAVKLWDPRLVVL